MRERFAGVVGYPVEHSLSPKIFSALSRVAGIALEYRKIPIAPAAFRRELRAATRSREFHGWNVTIPHKEKAAGQVDRLDPASRVLGAVNVVRFRGKKVLGYNTDVAGVLETLRRCRFSPRGKTAVIYGAGGGAAAVAFALGEQRAAKVVLVNRTPARARALAAKMRRAFHKTEFVVGFHAPAGADLYVNATPLGMKGFPRSPKLPRFERRGVLVFDLVYRPLETQFLRSARKQRVRTMNGLEMLVTQAIATWEIWFGKLPRNFDRKKVFAELAGESR